MVINLITLFFVKSSTVLVPLIKKFVYLGMETKSTSLVWCVATYKSAMKY